jgi:hypothetical protein
MVHDLVVHGGHALEDRQLGDLDEVDRRVDVPLGQRVVRGTAEQGRVHHGVHAVDVEQGQHAEHAIAGLHAAGDRLDELVGVPGQVLVRKLHPLWRARGPARVRQHRQLVPLDVGNGVPGLA